MPGSGNNGTVRTLVTACSVRSGDVYERYVSGLYRQAFLALGDKALAVRVVSDAIADECALAPAWGCGEDDVRHRLAESVFQRCQQLASDPAASSAAVAETAEEQERDDAETRIRHGDHRGSCRSRARGDGGQVAAGGAAVHGDQEDVTRVASRSLAASRPRAACHCHHVRPVRGEWDAYAGVGPADRYGAA
jgi:hypothetical protein